MVVDQDPRAEELNKLKLALAIFSMHLDAFEARVKGDLIAKKRPEAPIKPHQFRNQSRLSDGSRETRRSPCLALQTRQFTPNRH
jgi:hypothetical protein